MTAKLYETPVKTMLECEMINGTLRVFIGQIDIPVLAHPGQRLILRPDGDKFVIEHELR